MASISKPYKGVEGIRRSYLEARRLLEMASMSGQAPSLPLKMWRCLWPKKTGGDNDALVVNAVRRNNTKELKEAFIHLIYSLPSDEEKQCRCLQQVMLKTEFMLQESYGLTEAIEEKFRKY